MGGIKSFFNRNFREPVVYSLVAEMLRNGAPVVRVKYRNRSEARYYTGTGNLCNSGIGHRKRWNMIVHRFDSDAPDATSKFINLGLPWMDGKELDVLLAWDWSNVARIEEVHFYDTELDQIKTEITNVIRRLKPGQGYDFHGANITQDTIQPDGFALNHGATSLLIPESLLATRIAIPAYIPDKPFDPKKVYVSDEKLIKRQHRPNSDLLRWLEIKQVPSVDDGWAIRYTPYHTAATPVFYYSVEINIDNKSMKAYPFYIKELMDHALKQIRKLHGDGHYSLNQIYIKVTWNGETKPLLAWIDNARRYPRALDEQPNIIYKTLQTEASIKYDGNMEFIEVTSDKD